MDEFCVRYTRETQDAIQTNISSKNLSIGIFPDEVIKYKMQINNLNYQLKAT